MIKYCFYSFKHSKAGFLNSNTFVILGWVVFAVEGVLCLVE